MVKKQNKSGETIILFKAFRRKILLVDAVRSWWSCIYQEFKDIFEENEQGFKLKVPDIL